MDFRASGQIFHGCRRTGSRSRGGGRGDGGAAEAEAAGAASSPTQKISYITGKWQIMNLLGRYKDRQGENFRLGQFHDDPIKNGTLQVSVVEWVLLNDPTAIQQTLK